MSSSIAFFLLALTLVSSGPAHAEQDEMNLLFTAQEWQAKGNLEAARRAVQETLGLDPQNAFARIRLAQIDAVSGQHQKALDELSEVLRLDPNNLLALLWRGHILLAEGKFADAEASYRRVSELDTQNGWGHLGVAVCLLAGNNASQAVVPLSKAQSCAGEDADLHLALGDTFSRMGLPANARMELERSLEINPRGLRALVLAGEVYLKMGFTGLAMNAWRQALALDPACDPARIDLLFELGRQAGRDMAQGRKEEAVRGWRTMLSYDPRNPEALNALKSLK
jgi:tetratricopeptide (TPR) repeat protein